MGEFTCRFRRFGDWNEIVGPRDIELQYYPDGMPMVKGGQRDRVVSLTLRPTTLQSFVSAMFWVDAYADRNAGEVPELILPFIPGSRQDRPNPTGDLLFTAKSIAGMINARRFPKVTVFDPHSDVSSGLIDRCEVIRPHFDEITDALVVGDVEWDAVIAPDAGGSKRAGAVADALGLPLIHAFKSRDVSTGYVTTSGHEPIPDGVRNALVVDDICDGGRTFTGLADALPPDLILGLYVSHGIFSKGFDDLFARYVRIITTDSVFGQRPTGAIAHALTEIPITAILEGTQS